MASKLLNNTKFSFAHKLSEDQLCNSECSLLSQGHCPDCNSFLEYHQQVFSRSSKTYVRKNTSSSPSLDQLKTGEVICTRLYLTAKLQETWAYPVPASALGHICASSPIASQPRPQVTVQTINCTKPHLENHECPPHSPCHETHLSDHKCPSCVRPHLSDHTCDTCTKDHLDDHVCESSAYDAFTCTRTHLEPCTPDNLSEILELGSKTPPPQLMEKDLLVKNSRLAEKLDNLLNFSIRPAEPDPKDQTRVRFPREYNVRHFTTVREVKEAYASAKTLSVRPGSSVSHHPPASESSSDPDSHSSPRDHMVAKHQQPESPTTHRRSRHERTHPPVSKLGFFEALASGRRPHQRAQSTSRRSEHTSTAATTAIPDHRPHDPSHSKGKERSSQSSDPSITSPAFHRKIELGFDPTQSSVISTAVSSTPTSAAHQRAKDPDLTQPYTRAYHSENHKKRFSDRCKYCVNQLYAAKIDMNSSDFGYELNIHNKSCIERPLPNCSFCKAKE